VGSSVLHRSFGGGGGWRGVCTNTSQTLACQMISLASVSLLAMLFDVGWQLHISQDCNVLGAFLSVMVRIIPVGNTEEKTECVGACLLYLLALTISVQSLYWHR